VTPVIEQTVSFPKVTPVDLYELFMDSAKHSAATGMPAKISRKVGGKWSAFGGMILGKTLALVPNRMIVQAWRSSAWKKADPDSILVVRFQKARDGAAAHLAHVGVPPYDLKGVTQGWKKYYWEPWRKYLMGLKHKALR
jgi:activator of HSP90 ATPase